MSSTDCIVETLPDSLIRKSFRNHLLVVLLPVAFVFLGTFFFVCLDLDYEPWEALLGSLFMVSLLLVPAGAAFAGISMHLHTRLRNNVPKIELRGEQLTVHYGCDVLSASTRECRIRCRGPIWRMMLVWDNFDPRFAKKRRGIRLWSWQPVILIELPPFGKTILGAVASLNTVAVGYTDEMLERWESALNLPPTANDFDLVTRLCDLFMVASWAAPEDGLSRFHRSQTTDGK
ncbi:MAG: hypothetical protein AAGI63_12755 [Planctomycetota bacterium]